MREKKRKTQKKNTIIYIKLFTGTVLELYSHLTTKQSTYPLSIVKVFSLRWVFPPLSFEHHTFFWCCHTLCVIHTPGSDPKVETTFLCLKMKLQIDTGALRVRWPGLLRSAAHRFDSLTNRTFEQKSSRSIPRVLFTTNTIQIAFNNVSTFRNQLVSPSEPCCFRSSLNRVSNKHSLVKDMWYYTHLVCHTLRALRPQFVLPF